MHADWARLARWRCRLALRPPPVRTPKRPWLDPALLAAAQKEGPLVVYSSMNEQEGLPLFKIFTDATGIKVNYVRGSDTQLMGRTAIEFRTKLKAWDIIQTTTINKMPAPMLAQVDLPEGKALSPDAIAPDRRWYGMYANYNGPAYNTKLVKREELPKTYEEFLTKKQWANRVAIDGTDNEWLKAMFVHYGEQRATEIIKGIVATLNPVVTDGHLALARATGAGEYAISLNNYVNLSMNVKLAGGPIDVWAMDPVALMFGQVGVSALAPNPNAAKLAANFMISQEAPAVHRQVRPPADTQRRHRQSARHRRDAQAEKGHPGAADAGGGKGLAAPVPGTVQAAVMPSQGEHS